MRSTLRWVLTLDSWGCTADLLGMPETEDSAVPEWWTEDYDPAEDPDVDLVEDKDQARQDNAPHGVNTPEEMSQSADPVAD